MDLNPTPAIVPIRSGCHLSSLVLPPREELRQRDVDLWYVLLPVPASIESIVRTTLSEQENKRAAHFITAAKRSEFVAGRGVLRLLLSRYLEVPPASIALSTRANGKPALAGNPGLFFNLSHTEGLLVVAIASGMEVGVDVERIRHIEGSESLSSRYFSARERAATGATPDYFLRLWTCRESALKAFGTGISAGWNTLKIVERSPESADAVGPGQNCHIRHFTPAPGYVAAIAALSSDFHVRQARQLLLTELDNDGALDDHLKLR